MPYVKSDASIGAESLLKQVFPNQDSLAPAALAEFDRLVSILPPREKQVLEDRHGYNGPKETLVNVATKMTISPSRVTQLERKGISKLRIGMQKFLKGPISAVNVTLDDLDLDARTRRLMGEMGIKDLFELCAKTSIFYMGIPGFGENSLKKLKEELSKYGKELRPVGEPQ